MADENNTLLYVDDESINLMLFDKLFSKNYNVITAESGFKALDLMQKHPEIKLIFSDMKMPEMNGIEFIKKAQQQYSDKCYYIISGYEINDEIDEALTKGLISDYFKKPFNMVELNNAIQKNLEQ
ncbi:response regulator [Plebeiibacterium sediminum]|uniref:Response regulator n=1 Tax=Plebeiibacterium sediminum TaxID=2992112 RepID=A0AAE3M3W7_9BACT|nr:response regulator [Plebeiobacterium sediminum]MCW3786608.1 response regulator [Plebeiobacterium sediminum]